MRILASFIITCSFLLTGCFGSPKTIAEAVADEKASDQALTAMVIKYFFYLNNFHSYDAALLENDTGETSTDLDEISDRIETMFVLFAKITMHENEDEADETSKKLATITYGDKYTEYSKSENNDDQYFASTMEYQAYFDETYRESFKLTNTPSNKPSINNYINAFKSYSVTTVTPYHRRVAAFLDGHTEYNDTERKLLLVSDVIYNGDKWQIDTAEFYRQINTKIFNASDYRFKDEYDELPKDISDADKEKISSIFILN